MSTANMNIIKKTGMVLNDCINYNQIHNKNKENNIVINNEINISRE